MRNWIAKFVALAVVGFLAFGAIPVESAKAQTQAQIDAAVAAAASNPQALASFLNTYPGAAQALGDAVAGALNAGGPGTAGLAAALVATGNSGLISGVMIANGMSSTAQSAIAGALVASGNTTLVATVQAQVQQSGATGALAVLNTQIATSGVALPTVVASLPPVVVVVIPNPSPAQSGSTSTTG